MNRNNAAAMIAFIVVVVVLILGFRFLGGPASQRLAREDAQDAWALSGLAQQLYSYRNGTARTLPENLDKIIGAKKTSVNGKPFVYHRKDDDHYELCSIFATDNRQHEEADAADLWRHPRGEYCFALDASQPVPTAPYMPY